MTPARQTARRRPGWAWFVLATGFVGCGGAPLHLQALDDVERTRTSAGAQDGAKVAPETYAQGESEREAALHAHAAGDDVAASLHAQRAVAAYRHGLLVARLARATADLAEAQKALDDAAVQEQALDASHARLERDADELEQHLRLARERTLPSSAPASPEREAARTVAARSLAMQAKLLCGAARLIAPDSTDLADASGQVHSLDERLAKNPRPAPIDDAARSRTRCLDVLTRARRATGDDAGTCDALLGELSAAGGWDPSRDERGVGITLHDVFQGSQVTPAAAERLKELGRVAAAHPAFAVQVVVHDAEASAGDVASSDGPDAKRADAAIRALQAGGANPSRTRAELAGARAPIVDPSDARGRARNERLEVVFIDAGH